MVLTGFVGRLPLSMVGLGCVLMIVEYYPGKSYALGGAAAAVGAVATAILGPIFGRLADAYGQRKVLVPVVTAFALGGLLFIIAVRAVLPVWVVFLGAAIAGGCIPPIASMTRARWVYLLDGSRRLPTALAFESVEDELCFIIGPVLVTFLSTTGHTTSGLVTAFVLAIVGGLGFAVQRRTVPPPDRAASRGGPSAIRTPGLVVLCMVGLAMGVTLGTMEVTLVAFADEQNAKQLSGALIAALAVGSMASGLTWGSIHWVAPLHRRQMVMLGALAIGTLPLLIMPNIGLMIVFVAICGVAVSPSLITAFTLVEILVPRHATTEAYTWIGTTVALGVAGGTSAAGAVIDQYGANLAFGVATVAAAFALLIVWMFQRLLIPGRRRRFKADPAFAYPEPDPAAEGAPPAGQPTASSAQPPAIAPMPITEAPAIAPVPSPIDPHGTNGRPRPKAGEHPGPPPPPRAARNDPGQS